MAKRQTSKREAKREALLSGTASQSEGGRRSFTAGQQTSARTRAKKVKGRGRG
jgi:hypothetical protein